GSTTARCTPSGMNGRVLASTSAPCSTCSAPMPWVMSTISTSGAIDLITPWQVPTKSSCRPKSLRKVTNMAATLSARREDGLDQTVEIVSASLFDDSHPGFSRCRGRRGTDRDSRDRDTELGVGPGGRRRGEHDQVALQRLCRT